MVPWIASDSSTGSALYIWKYNLTTKSQRLKPMPRLLNQLEALNNLVDEINDEIPPEHALDFVHTYVRAHTNSTTRLCIKPIFAPHWPATTVTVCKDYYQILTRRTIRADCGQSEALVDERILRPEDLKPHLLEYIERCVEDWNKYQQYEHTCLTWCNQLAQIINTAHNSDQYSVVKMDNTDKVWIKYQDRKVAWFGDTSLPTNATNLDTLPPHIWFSQEKVICQTVTYCDNDQNYHSIEFNHRWTPDQVLATLMARAIPNIINGLWRLE
jgi:hypothetical protein